MSDLRAEARALVERTTKAQGLPEQIADPTVLVRIALLFAPTEPKARKTRRRPGQTPSSASPSRRSVDALPQPVSQG